MTGIAGQSMVIVKNNLVLLAAIIALFFINYYSKTLFFRPGSIHQWRQADCLSIAKNYYEEGMNFFEPKIHFQGPVGGKAVSECPILNYTAAALWKIFGEHEFIYRLLEYIIFIIAIFSIFNLLFRHYRSFWLSFFAAGFFLTSPLLAYYSLNFIADVPAMSLGMICFCLFFEFYHTQKLSRFYLSLFIGTLAVLIKASALIGVVLLIFFSLIDLLRLNDFFGTRRLFVKRSPPLIAIIVCVILVISWYRFALQYNLNISNNIFLLTVLPIWEMDEVQLIYNLKMLFNNLFPLFLNKPMFFLFFALVMYVIARFKSLENFLKYSFVISGAFFLFYLLFFFQVFSVHDYYLVNLMIFPLITIVCTISLLSKPGVLLLNKGFIRLFVIITFFFNSFHAAAIYRLRTVEDDKMVYWFPFISEEEKNLAKYNFWEYGNNIKRVEHIEDDLRNAGIKREDFVLSIPDNSFDISLYLMDQKGYTVAKDHIQNDSTVMDRFLGKVKYVIFSDTNLKQEKAYKRLAHHFEPFLIAGPVQVLKVKPGR
jgi:hypothetical protein